VVRTLKGPEWPVSHIRFSPDGRLLATTGEDSAIRVWTLAGGDHPVVLTGTVERTTATSFSPDGKLIAGVGTNDVVRLWNTDGSGEPLTFDHPRRRSATRLQRRRAPAHRAVRSDRAVVAGRLLAPAQMAQMRRLTEVPPEAGYPPGTADGLGLFHTPLSCGGGLS
jgi:glucose/arabinose dehydrogenase